MFWQTAKKRGSRFGRDAQSLKLFQDNLTNIAPIFAYFSAVIILKPILDRFVIICYNGIARRKKQTRILIKNRKIKLKFQ